ncbi:Uncharacterised protein [uncultured archaeon]|nr:Uncharacterised protein [uncultured archaeon]
MDVNISFYDALLSKKVFVSTMKGLINSRSLIPKENYLPNTETVCRYNK